MVSNNILPSILLAATLIAATSAQICTVPIQEALAPCECWEEPALRIFCHEETDLKAVFERVSSLVDSESVLFDQIHIGNHPVSEIPANIFGSLKAKEINFYTHSKINSIHPDAFNSTYETTTKFMAFSNGLVSTEENHELFKLLNRFRQLEELDIGDNEISYIPDDPFPQPMAFLKKVSINYNNVDYLGAGFFANLPALERAEFVSLGLSLDKLTPAAFEGIGPNVQLFLPRNGISYLPEAIFGPVLESAAALTIAAASCQFGFCRYERLDCDERIDWICKDVDLYEPKVDTYFCKEGAGADHIWEYCANLNNNTTTIH